MAKTTKMNITFDEILPKIKISKSEVISDVAIIEVIEKTHLVEIANNKKIGCYLLGRLSETTALVDPNYQSEVAAALLAAGYTPKLLEGI